MAPEYLAAILGVETYYGRLTGSYRVLDALATLAFDYPARSQVLPRRTRAVPAADPRCAPRSAELKGSYAGAMGAPQFMPSNYRALRGGCGRDGRVDLWTNWADVCASVGNYLKEIGWKAGEPVLAEANVARQGGPDLDGRKLALIGNRRHRCTPRA